MKAHAPPKGENLALMANRLFLRHVVSAGGLGCALAPSRAAITDLVGEFSAYILEGEPQATPAEFLRRMILALERIAPLDETTKAIWQARMREPEALLAFDSSMAISPARELI
jgi:hypothetical protein